MNPESLWQISAEVGVVIAQAELVVVTFGNDPITPESDAVECFDRVRLTVGYSESTEDSYSLGVSVYRWLVNQAGAVSGKMEAM